MWAIPVRQSILLFVFACLSLPALAQDCSCADSFEEVVQHYEQNYSLFKIKVTDSNRPIYQAYTELMREKAAAAPDLEACKGVLDGWLKFFRDGHIWLRPHAAAVKATAETYPISEKEFKARYKSAKKRGGDLIGIWKSGGYTVAILPEPKPLEKGRDFIGVILSSESSAWQPGNIKFELQQRYGNEFGANFYMGDHSLRKVEGKQKNAGLLGFGQLSDWVKVWPETEAAPLQPPGATVASGFRFELLEDKTPYLRLPTFYPEHKPIIDSLIKANHHQLVAADMLIIDVRENAGGSDYVYAALMPYILSGPIQLPQTGHYLSAYNKEQIGVDVKEEDLHTLDEDTRAIYKLFYDNQDTLIYFYPEQYHTYTPDTLYGQPKKVAILTSAKTGSSGETFVLRARQSRRVVLYGQNTAGVVDGFGGTDRELSCFTARYPVSVRASDVDVNPIDPYGIAPDVYLDASVDVLEFALRHMQLLLQREQGGSF
jgi:hypothetical protein